MSDTAAKLAPAELWTGKIYNGDWVESKGGTAPILEKATGETMGTCGVASAEDVADAAIIARKAQAEWAQMPGPHRGDILRKFSQLVLEHHEEIKEWIIRETGSIGGKGDWEVGVTSREVLEAAALPSEAQGMLLATEVPGRQSIARRLPLGVIGVITPWNSPFLLAARAYGPALATGNAVILKPDPQTPVCGGVLAAQLLEAAGLPKGLFHVLPGGAEAGEAVVNDPNIHMVSFTGSSAVGRKVGAMAGGHLKRTSLELGGNNALIILEDADVERATCAGAWGSFFHQGQICLTAGRHIVHEAIAERYVEALVERAARLPVGDPFREEVALGPIINEKQAANVERIIAESVAMGATVLTGGTREGLFFQPTVMTGVTTDMPVFKEEIFGPVAPIIVARDDEEIVRLANQTSYGLSAAIQSPDIGRARAIADQVHSGIIHINDQTVVHEVYGPIGGVGVSGNGYNYGTLTNADQFTEWQWLTVQPESPPYPM